MNKKDYHKKYNIVYVKTPRYRYNTYKQNAKARGLLFSMPFEEFKRMINGFCYYCGDGAWGIDRLDSSIGYIKDNIVPACSMCNQMKSNHNLEEFISKCRQITDFVLKNS